MRPLKNSEKIVLHMAKEGESLNAFIRKWEREMLNFDLYVRQLPFRVNQTCGYEKVRHTEGFRALSASDLPTESAYEAIASRPMRISFLPNFSPFSYARTSTGLDGIDVDMWKAITRHQGITAQFVKSRYLIDMPVAVSSNGWILYRISAITSFNL